MESPKKSTQNTPADDQNPSKKWIIPPLLDHDLRKFKQFIEVIGGKPLMICGPTGVGKSLYLEIFTKWYIKKNPGNPVLRVNIAAFNNNLIESELFGYAPNAFTGASSKGKVGFLKKANGGLLILEEIGEIPPNLQVKLLTFIEDGHFYPMGSEEELTSKITIVTTTNKGKDDNIRQDFWYRFAHHHVPPLYQRRLDIFYYIHFLFPDVFKVITQRELFYLLAYSWPGNVREIENAVHVIRVNYDRILRAHREKEFIFFDDGLLCGFTGINRDTFLHHKSNNVYFSYNEIIQYFSETFLKISPFGSDLAFPEEVKVNTDNIYDICRILYEDLEKYQNIFLINLDSNKNLYEISEGDEPSGKRRIMLNLLSGRPVPIHPIECKIHAFLRGDKLHSHLPEEDDTALTSITTLTEEQLLERYYKELAKESGNNQAEIARRAGLPKTTGRRKYTKYRPDNGPRGPLKGQ